MKNSISLLKSFVMVVATGVIISTATQAAFTDSTTNPGNVFTTGTADLKMLNDLSYGTYEPNRNGFYMTNAECTGVCEESVPGVTFDNIYPGWTGASAVKVANVGSLNLTLGSIASQTSGDPSLGDWIMVKVSKWDDLNENGLPEPTEIIGAYAGGYYTMSQWFTSSPFDDLGQINRINGENEVRGFIFEFMVDDAIPSSFQGSSMTADFTFTGTTTGAPQGSTP